MRIAKVSTANHFLNIPSVSTSADSFPVDDSGIWKQMTVYCY